MSIVNEKIITQRFGENMLLIQTVHCNVSIAEFHSEENGFKHTNKRRQDPGVRFDGLKHTRTKTKLLIPYRRPGYMTWDVNQNLQRLYYASPSASSMKTGNKEVLEFFHVLWPSLSNFFLRHLP